MVIVRRAVLSLDTDNLSTPPFHYGEGAFAALIIAGKNQTIMPVRNNADYGIPLQKLICDHYDLEVNAHAFEQFKANYNSSYDKELLPLCTKIFEVVGAKPTQLLTYTKKLVNSKQTTSPHNFLLANGKTLSVRTTKGSDKVAPRSVGQAGFQVLNDYFSDIFGEEIKSQEDVRRMVVNHIHEILPVFIDNLFQSDYTVLISRNDLSKIQVIRASDVGQYTFSKEDFTFTRGLGVWTESTTLKYHGKSIAEIQTHSERTFKFRFIISAIPEWFRKVVENNETLGMSAESAICEYFRLPQPDSFLTRCSPAIKRELEPVIKESFKVVPKAIKHTGSESGERGEQSKCSYDFVLEGDKTLSLKTNKGKMVCPPEVGQPGGKTCLLYFKDFLPSGISEVTNEAFKNMVYDHIADIIPIYVEHLFDSDWLLWIYREKKAYTFKAISQLDIKDFEWEKEKFSFTKPSIEEWNESNTVKYDGLTIGEFQVHNHRSCFKFRFQLANLLTLIQK